MKDRAPKCPSPKQRAAALRNRNTSFFLNASPANIPDQLEYDQLKTIIIIIITLTKYLQLEVLFINTTLKQFYLSDL